jgi:hypothetical protein
MSPTSLPWPQPTSASASYSLQCHCAAIQFTIKLSPPLLESEAKGEGVYTAVECDCTHCETKGIVACHPRVEDLKWETGKEVNYEFLSSVSCFFFIFVIVDIPQFVFHVWVGLCIYVYIYLSLVSFFFL